MQKIQILRILRALSIQHQGVCLNYSHRKGHMMVQKLWCAATDSCLSREASQVRSPRALRVFLSTLPLSSFCEIVFHTHFRQVRVKTQHDTTKTHLLTRLLRRYSAVYPRGSLAPQQELHLHIGLHCAQEKKKKKGKKSNHLFHQTVFVNMGHYDGLKVHSYYAAIALHCRTTPYCTEIVMLLHCCVAWKLNSFQLEMRWCCGDLRQKVIDISTPQCNCSVVWTDLYTLKIHTAPLENLLYIFHRGVIFK